MLGTKWFLEPARKNILKNKQKPTNKQNKKKQTKKTQLNKKPLKMR